MVAQGGFDRVFVVLACWVVFEFWVVEQVCVGCCVVGVVECVE